MVAVVPVSTPEAQALPVTSGDENSSRTSTRKSRPESSKAFTTASSSSPSGQASELA